MINTTEQDDFRLRWPAICWRLLVTLLLLLLLTGFGLTTFERLTATPGSQVVPTVAPVSEAGP